MIKAIIMDVDGVIIGKKQGVNFPLPNTAVIARIRSLHASGIPVVLCTAKFNYAIQEIIIKADLRNPHITDGGALIIDPLNDKFVKKYTLTKRLAKNILKEVLKNFFYAEVYGVDNYYLLTYPA